MREAIGSAFLVNLILIFIAVISALVIGSISYSKAYKVKDKIIYAIEKYDGWTNKTQTEVDKSLMSIGYKVNSGKNSSCEKIYKRKIGDKYKVENLIHGANLGVNEFDYCVYHYKATDFGGQLGDYYGVTTFMHFDIPLIGGLLEFPVSGETSVIYDVIDN